MNTEKPKKIAVIAGAGPAGLTAALELLRRSDIMPIVFEADAQVGGISKTINYRGNRMDLGGHRFFSKSDWVMRWWQEILPLAADQTPLDGPLRINYQRQSREWVPEQLRPHLRRRHVGSSAPVPNLLPAPLFRLSADAQRRHLRRILGSSKRCRSA